MIFFFEMIGTVAFAVSGAIVGMQKKMDLLGVMILGMTTAVGGGILRDLILDVTPPMAFQKPVYAVTALIVSAAAFVPLFRYRINENSRLLLLMDALGLGIFTAVGIRASMDYHNAFLSLFVATVTGVGGGVIRDLFAGERPMIFVRHFYACASLIGAVICLFLWPVGEGTAMAAGTAAVLVLRLLAAHYKWNLPKA